MNLLNHAIEYRNQNLSVMPLIGKRPPEKWEYYQHNIPSEKQLRLWWGMYRTANIGIITGSISNLVVIDFDHDADVIFPKSYPIIKRLLGDSFIVSKTGKGFHCIVKTSDANMVRNTKVAMANRKVLIETRGEGGYIVAPPSIHPDRGTKYEFTNCKRVNDIDFVTGDRVIELITALRDEFHTDKQSTVNFSVSNNNFSEGVLEVTDIQSFVNSVLKKEREQLTMACTGERNSALFKSAAKLGSFRSYIGEGAILENLLLACNENGLIKDDGVRSAMKTIKSAMNKTEQITLKENPFKGMGIFEGD